MSTTIQSKRLSLTLTDADDLCRHYMPSIKDGGLFIPSDEVLEFHEQVVVQVALNSENKKILVPGRVVWVSPKGNHTSSGVGVQFAGEQKTTVKRYLEAMIGDRLSNPNLVFIY